MKSAIKVLLLVAIMLLMSACMIIPNNNQETMHNELSIETDKIGAESMVLTDRQKSILEEQNLPTTFEELNQTQQQAIIAIEEMFCYLDETYDVSFKYLGYRPETSLDKETLIVYPSDGVSADSVSVVRENGLFSDDYANLYYRDSYELLIKSFFEKITPHVEVFSDIAEVISPCDTEKLPAYISATSGIYLAGNEDIIIEDIAREFGDWYAAEAKDLSCSFSIYLIPEDVYWSITRYNRANYDDSVISRINITVRADGTVVIK